MTRGAARVTDPGEAEWVTQDQAAALTGAPLSSIDYWARSDKIQIRPPGDGPTVNRRSVTEYAAQRQQHRAEVAARKAARAAVRPHRRAPRPPNSITTAQAAAILGRSRAHIPVIARREGLTLTPWGGRVLLDHGEVESYAKRLARSRERWMSFGEAAKATGVSVGALQRAVKAGFVATNPDTRPRTPCLDRDSVAAWAALEKQRRHQTAARRALGGHNARMPDRRRTAVRG